MRLMYVRRIKGVLSVLGLLLLTFNIVGFFCGFVFIGKPAVRHHQTGHHRVSGGQTAGANLTDHQIRIRSRTTVPYHLRSQNTNFVITVLSPLYSIRPRQWKATPPEAVAGADLHPPSSPCLYRDGRGYEDGAWYDFSDQSLNFYAYSAFFDDRPSIGVDPVIRIIALSTKFQHDNITEILKTSPFCAYRYKNTHKHMYVVPMDPHPVPIGYGWDLRGTTLKEYIFTCPLQRRHPLPAAVTIVTNTDRLSDVTSCLPIDDPPKPKTKEHFAVCVQVSYGQLDPHRLIEWLELHRILGVTRVGIYDMSLEPGPGLDVLHHYAKEGFVELRKTSPLPIPGPGQYMLHGSPAINDCMYRNMHSFKWILVIDLDEAIVPRMHRDLKEMASYLENKTIGKNPPPVTFLIMNQYFFLNSEPDPNESRNFTMLRYRNKAPLSPQGYAMKSYVNPQGCLQMHNHYCMGVTKGFKGKDMIEFVHESVTTNQHYKNCHLTLRECEASLRNSTRDDVMMTYADELRKNAGKKMRTILKT